MQHGVFTQLPGEGIRHLTGVRSRVAAHRSGCGSACSLDVYRDHWRRRRRSVSRCMAATLWAGDGALLSHWRSRSGAGASTAFAWDASRSGCHRPCRKSVGCSGASIGDCGSIEPTAPCSMGSRSRRRPGRSSTSSGRLEDERSSTAMERAFRDGLDDARALLARLVALRTLGAAGAGRLEALLESRAHGRRCAGVSRSRRSSGGSCSATSVPAAGSPVLGRSWRVAATASTSPGPIDGRGRVRRLVAFHGRERFEQDERRQRRPRERGVARDPGDVEQVTERPSAVIARLRRRARSATSSDSLLDELTTRR